jgi:hypothetical protein
MQRNPNRHAVDLGYVDLNRYVLVVALRSRSAMLGPSVRAPKQPLDRVAKQVRMKVNIGLRGAR